MRDAGKTVLTPLKQAKDRNTGHFLQGETSDKILRPDFFLMFQETLQMVLGLTSRISG